MAMKAVFSAHSPDWRTDTVLALTVTGWATLAERAYGLVSLLKPGTEWLVTVADSAEHGGRQFTFGGVAGTDAHDYSESFDPREVSAHAHAMVAALAAKGVAT